MNLLPFDCQKQSQVPRKTEAHIETRQKIFPTSSRQVRVFSFVPKRLHQKQRKTLPFDLNSTKDSMNITQNTKPVLAGAQTSKVSRPLTAQNTGKNRQSGNSFEKFKLGTTLGEEQKQNIFGPVVQKISKPLSVRNANKSLDFVSTERQVFGINQYTLGKEIGKGAYAIVKTAVNNATSLKYAVKVYDKSNFVESSRMKNAYREIEILSQLSHPNIIKYYEHHDNNETLYLVLELVQGFSLNEYCKRYPERRIPEKEASRLFYQLIKAVSYCHSKKIAHRDIKFDNILVDLSDHLKLIDFGFSTNTLVPSKVFCGTPSYMAPEIIKKIDYIGPPVDVWACGVVLYGMLCGQFPFKCQNDKDCYRKILSGLIYIPAYISKSARELIENMLRLEPEKRILAEDVLKSRWFIEAGVVSGEGQSDQSLNNDRGIEHLV